MTDTDGERSLALSLWKSAETFEERADAFEALQEFEKDLVVRRSAEVIATTSWGRNLRPETRREVARYAHWIGTDPVRHWEVLGGNLYDKAELWLDYAASRPDYEGHEFEHVNDDERLTDAAREQRRQRRAEFNIPDDVAGACIVTIYRTGRRPFIGINHAGNRHGYSARAKKIVLIEDPIGEENPGKTAFTRAFRRAAKQAWPLWFGGNTLLSRDTGQPVAQLRESVSRRLTHERQQRHATPVEGELGYKPASDLGDGLSVRAGSGSTGALDEPTDGAYGLDEEQTDLLEPQDDVRPDDV